MPALYLRLFHGREKPGTNLDDWGVDGPVIGPLNAVQGTYAASLRLLAGEHEVLFVYRDDLIFFDKMYYGDFTVVYGEPLPRDRVLTLLEAEKLAAADEKMRVTAQETGIQLDGPPSTEELDAGVFDFGRFGGACNTARQELLAVAANLKDPLEDETKAALEEAARRLESSLLHLSELYQLAADFEHADEVDIDDEHQSDNLIDLGRAMARILLGESPTRGKNA